MFRAIILPIFRSTGLCVTACGIMHPQSSAPEDGQNNCPKHVELTGIINKPLLLHIVVVYIIHISDARSSKYQVMKYIR